MNATAHVRYAHERVRFAGASSVVLVLAALSSAALAQPVPDDDDGITVSDDDDDTSGGAPVRPRPTPDVVRPLDDPDPPPSARPSPVRSAPADAGVPRDPAARLPARPGTSTVAPPVAPRALPAPVQIRSEVAVPAGGPHLGSRLEEIIERLETRASYLRKGNATSADVELGQLFELRDALGAVNVPLASSLLVHESREALARGDRAAALAAADAAARLSPDLVAAHWQRFDVELAGGEYVAAIGAVRDAMAARGRGFRNQIALLTDLLGILVLTILGVVALYTLLQLVRYVRCGVADVTERLPSWAGALVGSLVVGILLFLPLAVGLGFAPTLAVWLSAAMLYQTTRERVASLVLLAALGAIPLVMYFAAPLLLVHGSSVDALAALATEAFAPDAEARLVAAAEKKGSKDYELSFLLARRARAVGDLDGARRWYDSALAARPGDAAARNNLGVILYLQRQPDAAMTAWRQAGRAGAEPLLNMSAVDLEASRFDEAKTALEQARRIDPARTRQFSDAAGSTADRLVDAPFDQSVLWTRLSRDVRGDASAVVEGLWSRVGGQLIPWNAFLLVALALGLIAWALGGRRQAPFSTPCHKCGQPAHRRAPDGYCTQCQTIFLRAVAVEPGMRMAKERAIRRYSTRTQWGERVLSLLAGAGHVLGGRPVEGLLLLVFFVGVAVHWLWMERLSVHPWATGVGISHVHLVTTAIVCGVLALFALRRTWAR